MYSGGLLGKSGSGWQTATRKSSMHRVFKLLPPVNRTYIYKKRDEILIYIYFFNKINKKYILQEL